MRRDVGHVEDSTKYTFTSFTYTIFHHNLLIYVSASRSSRFVSRSERYYSMTNKSKLKKAQVIPSVLRSGNVIDSKNALYLTIYNAILHSYTPKICRE